MWISQQWNLSSLLPNEGLNSDPPSPILSVELLSLEKAGMILTEGRKTE